MKSYVALISSILISVAFPVFGQLNTITVETGDYTPGSTIAAVFNIPPSSCISIGNKFELELSDANGNFTAPIVIGQYNSFYSTFVNGKIPLTTPVGSGYKLRITSSAPAYVSQASNSFSIVMGSSAEAKIISNKTLPTTEEAFGFCTGQTGTAADITLSNQSTPTGTVTASINNEIDAGTTSIAINPQATVNLQNTHYTMLVKVAMPNGNIATKAYFLINNNVNTSFTTSNTEYVCLPDGFLTYYIDVTSNNGIQRNFPGNTYRINWGDNIVDTYSFCDLKIGSIKHKYSKSSCGQKYQSGLLTIYNSFGINIQTTNPFCGDVGSSVSTSAKVVNATINSFDAPPTGCKDVNISFFNTSILGDSCMPNSTFNWYVDGILQAANKPLSYTFNYIFTTNGLHTVRLESQSSYCSSTPIEKTICIKNKPQPLFSLPNNKICAGSSIIPVNNSVLDNTCGGEVVYSWNVSPLTDVTYANGTTSKSETPEFVFNKAGNYTISLSIITSACGEIISNTQSVIVNGPPIATLSPNVELCKLGTYVFNADAGPTQTALFGTSTSETDTYTWLITGSNYAFTAGSDLHTKFPSIQFLNYGTYTVNLTHKNNCGTVSKTQTITFTPSPTVSAGTYASLCYNDAAITLNGSITGTTNSIEWIGGKGTFTPSRNVLNAVYTPTTDEKNLGSVSLKLRANTGLAGACSFVDDDTTISFKPKIIINSASTKGICTGTSLNYIISSTVVGTTFTWTAVGDENASGFSPSGSGNITDVLNNKSLTTNAVTKYTITPTFEGCTGDTFTLLVNITPVPTVTAASLNTTICNDQNAIINLSSNILETTYTWTSNADFGITGNTSNATPTAINQIIDKLINTQVTAGKVTYEITPTLNNGCTGSSFSLSIIVNPSSTLADAGTDQLLCNQTTTTLNGNIPLSNTGLWALISTQTGVIFNNPSSPNTSVSGLQPGETYIFKWTITGQAPCAPSTDEVIVSNLTSLNNNTLSTPFLKACTNQVVSVSGSLPTGGNGIYYYTWQSSTNNGASWSTMTGQTDKDLNTTLITSTSYRRIVNSGPCSLISNIISITALPSITNNLISTNQTICITTTPTLIVGSLPNGGDGTNYSYTWEQSTDNGLNWDVVTSVVTKDYQPGAITQTTLYRRLVSSSACSGNLQNVSNVIKITINLNAKADFTFTNNVGCVPFVINSANVKAVPYIGQNATYSWYADGILIGTGIDFPGYTINEANKSVTIKLLTTSSLGCVSDEESKTFSTRAENLVSFSHSTSIGCGPLDVTFTNTSTSLTDATFNWDFGNGTTSNLANPGTITFYPDPAGDDKEYTITLSLTTPCGTNSFSKKVIVKASAVSIFSPNKTIGCSPLTLLFSNTSLGNNSTYTFDFGDGTSVTTTNKNTVSHTYSTLIVQDLIVKMRATNECGTSESQYTIRILPNTITPELVVNSNQLSGCAPLTVDFFNNTKGANSFRYNFGDSSTIISNTLSTEKQTHTFTQPGTYTVELVATNGCSTATTTETITVFEHPKVAFKANYIIGCKGSNFKFSNTSTNAIGFLWDFGDGTTSTLTTPSHTYNAIGSYTVKLTAFNTAGCAHSTILTDYIKIVAPPVANFSISPAAVITIPSFTFKFTNESTNDPNTYKWSFGDGTFTDLKDPTHVYTDTGKFLVTLKAYNEQGCADSTQKFVQILGVPGYLYLPNSFIPGSASVPLQKFMAIGAGIKSWKMIILNKNGQVLWETTNLNDGKPVDGWDGTFKGVAQPQGMYFWKVDVELINGTKWKGVSYDKSAPKRTGQIYLIR